MKAPATLSYYSIILGVVLGIVMTIANTYLGLYMGMTVGASIPAAVIAIGVYRLLYGPYLKQYVGEINIVQTMTSAGESLAAGVIFVVPALILVGAWSHFHFWKTSAIAISGGLLGVIMMIPLRKILIGGKYKELIYPEGMACAQMINELALPKPPDQKAGSESSSVPGETSAGGARYIVNGFAFGGFLKILTSGISMLRGSVEGAFFLGKKVIFFGTDISLALLGVGYIVGFNVSALILLGGGIAWLIILPQIGTGEELLSSMTAGELAWHYWSEKVRFVGVGAMIVGGLGSVYSVRKALLSGLQALFLKTHSVQSLTQDQGEDQKNVSPVALGGIFFTSLAIILFFYQSLLSSWGFTFLTLIIMVFGSYIMTAVGSYICGLVGSSNSPVSGITICVLIGTAVLLFTLGFTGDQAILATLGVASIVCCAVCTAGDCSQDLKTGAVLKTSPAKQQIAQCLGVLIPAFFIAPTLSLLHSAYGIGDGLKAPQATLFAALSSGFFKEGGALPLNWLFLGIGIGTVLLVLDTYLVVKKSPFRLYVMPTAIGMYLPFTMGVPLFIGGLVSFLVSRRRARHSGSDSGILLSSGFVAGESVLGVLIALLMVWQMDTALDMLPDFLAHILSVLALLAFAVYLFKKSCIKI